MIVNRVSNISNTCVYRQTRVSKIKFGNSPNKNNEFVAIISSFPNVNEKNPSIQDEIEYEKCYKIVKDYLENNNSEDINLEDGLINFAYKGHHKIVDLLIKKYRVDVNHKDIMGSTPIMYAAMQGYIKTVDILGKNGAAISEKNNLGYNAIMLAAMNNHAKVLDKIISINPVRINDADDRGKTALMHAVILENKETIDKLIEYNANLDKKDCTGKTALMYAAANLDKITMNKLIKSGANTKIKDNLCCTADETYNYMFQMISLKISSGQEKSVPHDLLKRYFEIRKSEFQSKHKVEKTSNSVIHKMLHD